MVVGAPQTLSADVRWNKWLRWVRDNESFLAPEALLLTQEERANGVFDTKLVVRDFLEQQRGLAAAAVAIVDPQEDQDELPVVNPQEDQDELRLVDPEEDQDELPQYLSEAPTEDGDEEDSFWS